MLAPVEYFSRYGEWLSQIPTAYEAWMQTERDFNRTYAYGTFCFRRFLTYSAFRDALNKHLAGNTPRYIKIHILTVA